MSEIEFWQTRAGREYYERTLPQLVEQLKRLADAMEKLVAQQGPTGYRWETSGVLVAGVAGS